MGSSSNEDRHVRANVAPPKVPRWLAVAAGGVLVLVPVAWSCFGRGATQRDSALTSANADTSEYLQQIELARTLLDAGKARESIVLLERCNQLQPNAVAVHNNFCVAYGILERRDEAVTACRRALEIDPANQLAKNNLRWVRGIKPKLAQQ
jgi:tetratricopeptide (TPR) repeat protein